MSDFKNNKFLKFISSLFGQTKDNNMDHEGGQENNFVSCDLEDDQVFEDRIWKRDYEPFRQLLLWGHDDSNNPSFLILYGKHKFKNKRAEAGNVLQDEVSYSSYAVFKGKGGHLPSSQAVKIIEPYDYRSRSYGLPKLYHKRGLSYSWYRRENSEYLVKGFKNLPESQHISIPYFVFQSHDQYVQRILNRPRAFEGFRLAINPNEVLKLEGLQSDYLKIIVEMITHPNIYIRKKRLSNLINMNPPKEVYTRLLEVGSTETISGLFLELAKMGSSILVDEAKALLETEINWADENYAKGLKRCINIYINALDEGLKAERIKWIHSNLSKMDLKLININGKVIPQDKQLEGSAYRKYAASGLLQDYYWRYDYKTRKSTRQEAPKRYEEGIYSDGVRLKIIDFKNTLQEAEIYGLADVLGKIAYYLDAPRITYNLKGSGRGKALKYFRRYIIRVINSLADNNQEKFMEAMKHMLTSYTEQDYVCKFRGNFSFNELLNYYLENSFRGVGYNHLQMVADIALESYIEPVHKACYNLLKESPRREEFFQNISFQKLINLCLVSYEPLADMFKEVLNSKLEGLGSFDSELMIALIGASDKRMHEAAMGYFKRTKGLFSASDTADLLFLDNLEQWKELFRENLLSLEGEKYNEFIESILGKAGKFLELKKALPEDIRDTLSLSTNKMEALSEIDRLKLIKVVIAEILQGVKLPEWLGSFLEEVIFSVSYKDLGQMLNEISLEREKGWIHSRSKGIIAVLEAIKNKKIPEDSQMIHILSSGTSKIINMLFNVINENSDTLKARFSTLLIMLEADITVLNDKAKEIFNSMSGEEQRKLHALFIDSPVPKAYSFGLEKLNELYGEGIPETFLIQMLEHSSVEVKAYISSKTDKILDTLGNGNEKLFMYYTKTLLLLPNKAAKSKEKVYINLPKFALMYPNNLEEIQELLMDIGGSNIIVDSERALVALAKIRGEVVLRES